MLAYAESTDATNSNMMIVLISAGVVIAVSVLAIIPIRLAWSRRHKQSDAIFAMTVLWALLTAGTVVAMSMTQFKWSNERLLRIQSGYYDPLDNSDAPKWPVRSGAALAVAYATLIIWPLAQRRAPR
jgi:hypothetical protein